MLQDEYGVDPTSVEYFTGGEEEPGREEKVPLSLPPKFRVRAIAPDKTLSHMLAEGEIDAITAPRNPSTFVTRPDRVQRLFPNFIDVEKAYFRKTRIFPIMHTVVLRRDLYAANPWIAQSLTKAFFESKRRAAENLAIVAAIKTMLPWQIAYLEETRRELGEDWWPYGFEANRHVLDTFLRYHHEQGLSPKRFKPEDLFAPETFDSFKI
jgi:4,5-dihydroxyphthalate decarboxylase